jgi:hypothetical protein
VTFLLLIYTIFISDVKLLVAVGVRPTVRLLNFKGRVIRAFSFLFAQFYDADAMRLRSAFTILDPDFINGPVADPMTLDLDIRI